MHDGGQQREILAELAMSIGNNLDTQAMLKECLPVFLRGLNCTSATVLQEDDAGFAPVLSLPRNAPYLEGVVRDARRVLVELAARAEPLRVLDGRHFYCWPLQGFGLLLLTRSAPLSYELVQELRRLADKLAVALRSCAQFAQLRSARFVAEAANRAKSEFLATMSHELRTPMNAIIGLTDLALQAEMEAQAREYLGLVRISADHLLALINDVLDLSRIEAGKMELHAEDCVLRAELEPLVAGLAQRARDKGLELRLEVDPRVPACVRIDLPRLRQVLINLLGNAIKFTERGSVRLRVEGEAGGDLRLCVIDTGIGIATEQQARVFEAFTQADGSVSRRYGGTGLGLAISSRIVNLMGGRLWLESTPGEGSRFHVNLPFEPCAAASGALPPPPAPPAAEPPPLRILLAEDVPTNQLLARRLLEKRGHRVQVVADGAAAVAAWRDAPFDVILMDLMMPGLDGIGATQQIRAAEEGGRRTPIIALTANAMEGDRQLCLQAGMDGYVSKPLTPAALLAEMVRVLRR